MSTTTLAITIWTVIAVGWVGFLIIAGALARDAFTAFMATRRRSYPAEGDER